MDPRNQHDGYRLIVQREAKRARLFTRNGHDWTDRYPRIVKAALRNRSSSFVIDGEAVLLDVRPQWGCTDGLTFQDNSGATHQLPDIGTKSLRPNCYGAMRVYGYTRLASSLMPQAKRGIISLSPDLSRRSFDDCSKASLVRYRGCTAGRDHSRRRHPDPSRCGVEPPHRKLSTASA